MSTYRYTGELYIESCCVEGCGVTFGLDIGHYRELRRHIGRTFHCPNGHAQHYTGKSDQQKLKDAEAREVSLRDQLEASIRDREGMQQTILRERTRFANGVCPCCNRSFGNVRRHMASEHPDYQTAGLGEPIRYECGCGLTFETYRGLRIHQGKARSDDWAKPGQPQWRAHLTQAVPA